MSLYSLISFILVTQISGLLRSSPKNSRVKHFHNNSLIKFPFLYFLKHEYYKCPNALKTNKYFDVFYVTDENIYDASFKEQNNHFCFS